MPVSRPVGNGPAVKGFMPRVRGPHPGRVGRTVRARGVERTWGVLSGLPAPGACGSVGGASRAQPEPLHAAVDGERGAGDRCGARARQVGHGLGDLVGPTSRPGGLAGVERGALGRRVVGAASSSRPIQGVSAVPGLTQLTLIALAHVVGGHRQGEGEHGALAGAVQGALRQTGGRGDGAGVGDGGLAGPLGGGAAQVGQRGAGRCGPCRGR